MMEMSRQMVLFPLIAGFETKDYRRRRSRKKIVIGSVVISHLKWKQCVISVLASRTTSLSCGTI